MQANRGGELSRIERLHSGRAADVVVAGLAHQRGVQGQLVSRGGAGQGGLVLHPFQLILEGHLIGGNQQWVAVIFLDPNTIFFLDKVLAERLQECIHVHFVAKVLKNLQNLFRVSETTMPF